MFKKIKIGRVITQWVISTFGLLLIAWIFPGVTITHWGTAFTTAAVIGLLNALLWPLFMRFALPVTVLTLGLASLVLNGLIIALAAKILPGFSVSDFWSAMIVAIGVTVISTLTNQLLVINDEDTYYRNVIRRQSKKNTSDTETTTPGVLFLQIDGLAYKVLQRAIRDGNAPTFAKWLSSGTYRMESWETDWSSQTGASQAGILMGSNKDIPAFRWYDKAAQRNYTVSHPKDLQELEKRMADSEGLLAHDGASRGNLFSGDAAVTLLTLSTITNPNRKHFGQDYYAYFANPYNFTRTILLVIGDIIREFRASQDQKQRDVRPRLLHREWYYPLLRAWTTIVQRDILIQTLIADMYQGRSVVYADFVGYDEVSHHSGIERYETLTILRDIDLQIARLERAAKNAPRPYHLVILSDHGQTQGTPFSQLTGYKLGEYVEHLTNVRSTSEADNHEDLTYLHAAVTEASGVKQKNGKKSSKSPQGNGIKVISSGCLGLIYFTHYKQRLTLEEITSLYPKLIPGLVNNPYIGFLLVDSKELGGVVIGKDGRYILKNDHVDGKNPLSPFGDRAAKHIKRTHNFKFAGDIMINSIYDKTMDEVVPFEDFVGSHGGLGGNQSHPFIFFPRSWYYPEKEVIGAETIHTLMKRWLQDL
jgi:uncharacterized membrane protein YvlD (DUF360 family)